LTWDLIDLGLKPGRVEEKTGEEKIQCDLADPATRLTQLDPIKIRLQIR
jgi:hypothetical protein